MKNKIRLCLIALIFAALFSCSKNKTVTSASENNGIKSSENNFTSESEDINENTDNLNEINTVESVRENGGIISEGEIYPGEYISPVMDVQVKENCSSDSKEAGFLSQKEYAKVIQIGNNETIDGITASWLNVKTENVEGWIFGGYAVNAVRHKMTFKSRQEKILFVSQYAVSVTVDSHGYDSYVYQLEQIEDTDKFKMVCSSALPGTDDYIVLTEKDSEKVIEYDVDDIEIFYAPSFEHLYEFRMNPESNLSLYAIEENPGYCIPPAGTLFYENDNYYLTDTRSFKALKTVPVFENHNENSPSVEIRFADYGYKIKNLSNILKGQIYMANAVTVEKFSYNGKAGRWYRIMFEGYGGDSFMLEPDSRPYVWVFEDFLKPVSDESEKPDTEIIAEELKKLGAIPVSEAEKDGKWVEYHIEDWDSQISDDDPNYINYD